jgi:pimeloyl-ACP methyl ester carboxylesterase
MTLLSTNRWALALAGGVTLFALPVEVRYFVKALSLFRPPRKPVTEADRQAAHARLPRVEEVSFRASDGLTLRGFYVPSRNGATLVMGHGLTENRMRFLPVAEMLARHGYGSLLFDWRAHGESDGEVSTWSDHEQRDFAAAVDFASNRPDVLEGRIAGLGFSIGASTVALEAARDSRVRAVIVEALYTSFGDEMRSKMGGRGALSLWPAHAAARFSGIDFDHIRPIDHVSAIAPRPLLFIGGSRDGDTPPPVVRRVFDAAAEPKELWLAEGADHGEYWAVAPVEYERIVVSFLDRAFFPIRR